MAAMDLIQRKRSETPVVSKPPRFLPHRWPRTRRWEEKKTSPASCTPSTRFVPRVVPHRSHYYHRGRHCHCFFFFSYMPTKASRNTVGPVVQRRIPRRFFPKPEKISVRRRCSCLPEIPVGSRHRIVPIDGGGCVLFPLFPFVLCVAAAWNSSSSFFVPITTMVQTKARRPC